MGSTRTGTSRHNGGERILVVDDAADTLEIISRNLSAAGYRVVTASSVVDAIGILDKEPVDLVITDLKMPQLSGMNLVRHVREHLSDTEVMMITGYATVEGAVEAMKTGAEEFISKPFTDQEILDAVARAIDKLHLGRATRSRSLATPTAPHGFIGESEAMVEVYRAIAKAARANATVLISGESGTGKELVARAVHYSGPDATRPFVAVNCGGIPENLLESELFGYVKGAFTGATETRAGFFQTADGGTIFLDEVSEMSLNMQVKLLRALQEKEICMVGSNRTRKVDVRILAATNKDLSHQVTKGQFREDLFYRLNVIAIELPPLRARDDDILLLINHFLHIFAKDADRKPPRFSQEALVVLRNYHWPGNVRELQNVIQRLTVMIDGETIGVPDLPSLMRCAPPREVGFRRTLAEVEIEYIRNVLSSVNGNKTRAAAILGIDRKTLRVKLKQLEAAAEE
jgi:DNA-binding NtrC family response regulator